jgi:hypothetical protein
MFILCVCVCVCVRKKSLLIVLSPVSKHLSSTLWVRHCVKRKLPLRFLLKFLHEQKGCRICEGKTDCFDVIFEGLTAMLWRLHASEKLRYVVGYIRPDISNIRMQSNTRRVLVQAVLGLLYPEEKLGNIYQQTHRFEYSVPRLPGWRLITLYQLLCL